MVMPALIGGTGVCRGLQSNMNVDSATTGRRRRAAVPRAPLRRVERRDMCGRSPDTVHLGHVRSRLTVRVLLYKVSKDSATLLSHFLVLFRSVQKLGGTWDMWPLYVYPSPWPCVLPVRVPVLLVGPCYGTCACTCACIHTRATRHSCPIHAMAVKVYRATAVIGVRPATVFSAEHTQVVMSQSQSHECPRTSMLSATELVVGVNVWLAEHV